MKRLEMRNGEVVDADGDAVEIDPEMLAELLASFREVRDADAEELTALEAVDAE